MEDWGSPWADDEKLDDEEERKLPLPKVKNGEVESDNPEKEEEEVARTPVTEERKGVGAAAAGLAVDWDSGFADSSAWANATPRVQVGDGDSFGWGVLPSEDLAGVGAKGSDDSEEEGEDEGRIEDDWKGSGKDEAVKTTKLPPISTDEVNAWGAGSDWGDPRTPRTPEPRTEGTKDALGLSLGGVGVTHDGRFDTEVKDSPTIDVERHDQLIDAETLLNSPTKQRAIEGETQNAEDHLQTVLQAVSDSALQTQGDLKDSSTPSEPHSTTPPIHEASSSKDDDTNANASDQDDDDDDFGDFAAEGEEFEEPQAPIPEPVLPPAIKPPLPDSFEIDVSLVSKLYPIPTSRPDPPPIDEIISTTESRKAWYRLSTSVTIRRNRSGDDDYVRVMWVGSKVQENVNKIVEKWITDDRNSGGGGLMGGGKRVSAMFGWGDSTSKISDQKPISLSRATPQLPSGGHSRKASGSGSVSTSTQNPSSKPASFGISSSSESVGGGSVSSPRATSFGWSSTQPQSSPSSVKGEEKTPSTPVRTSFHSSTRNSLSSQPSPPKGSTAPHSPTTDNESAGRSMVVPSSTLFPTHLSTADIKNSPIVPTPEFPSVVVNSITADPLTAGLPADVRATDLATASSFGDWGAFENMSANAPPTSADSQSRNYDEWGAFEDLATSGSSSSAPKEGPPLIGSQNSPVATNLNSAVPAPIPSVQSSSESHKKLNSAQTALGPADTTIDNWGDLESLSSQPPKLQTPSNVSSSHVPKNQNINSLAWSESKNQKTSQSSSFEGSRKGSGLSTPPTGNMLGGGSFISAPMNGSAADSIKKRPVISNVQTQQDDDEEDDWGEMVQSPTTSTGVIGFSEALRMPAPASSQDITSLRASIPLVPSIPQRVPTLDLTPMPSPTPAPVLQPTSEPSAALSPGDLGQKSGSNIGDSWDLSFFEGPATPNSGFHMPKDIPEPASQDLWDTPAVVQGKAPESVDDKAIREIVEGLPDLSYMLG
ncbi:hypothetical protein L873DRAFT_1669652 [Choiromyces venosus 120613-1]|uniref:Uncharacterized protein n=1 Tax=Choiromyces venosus 120613-1 TaxID=1336337 RepID=A0A3N4JYZ6_9PEZI|nr:hypothetical protein L873DRAFT_1669652 [Choiromyces venosus 120613-1]